MDEINEEEFNARMAEIRASHPRMFDHPELKEGEMAVYSATLEATVLTASHYRGLGIPSARVSEGSTRGKVVAIDDWGCRSEIIENFHVLFVNQREWYAVDRAHILASTAKGGDA
jgi:hypothetical protein